MVKNADLLAAFGEGIVSADVTVDKVTLAGETNSTSFPAGANAEIISPRMGD